MYKGLFHRSLALTEICQAQRVAGNVQDATYACAVEIGIGDYRWPNMIARLMTTVVLPSRSPGLVTNTV